MKSGANVSEIARIRALFKEGVSESEISKKLFIEKDCVKAFLPQKKRKTKKKA